MSRILSFPGLLLFLAAGLMELMWIAPIQKRTMPREGKMAQGAGICILAVGVGLYVMGQMIP